jgi:hypothetical protein
MRRFAALIFFQVYRPQTNSPAPTNLPPPGVNKSPHANNTASLYPPSNAPSGNINLQQQRSPAASVPSPSPSGPMASSISPHSNQGNPPMNKAPTPQPTGPTPVQSQPSVPRPYAPNSMMMQPQGPNGPRMMNGTGMDHPMNPAGGQPNAAYGSGQSPYMPPQAQHSYQMQQNGYGHHPNGAMPPQHYPMYHQQPSKLFVNEHHQHRSDDHLDPAMSVPTNQLAKPSSPLSGQQPSMIPTSSSPKPSTSSSPSQANGTPNTGPQQPVQQQQMMYNNYPNQQPMYHSQPNYPMQPTAQGWSNQPRMMMQTPYPPYPQGQYQAAPPPSQ